MSFKNCLYAALLVASTAQLASCDDIFRTAPINKISETEVWHNSMLLDEYVNSWYHGIGSGFKTFVPSIALVKSASKYYMPWFGDQLTVSKSDWFNAGYGDLLKGSDLELTNWARYNWNAYFTQIQAINKLFANEGSIADGDQKARVVGEAHFLRGYYYYLLWRLHGGVTIIDHPYDPLQHAEKFPRATYGQMLDFIVADADAAAKTLPASHAAAGQGRATKGAALMLKAKACLWASAEVFQNKPDTAASLGFTGDHAHELLLRAKAAYEELIALGAYRLIPIQATTEQGISEEYRKIFLTKNSEESIFEIQHSDDGDYAVKFGHTLDRDAASPFFTGVTAAYTPTQNHVDEYGMRAGAVYDPKHPYANRDYRFYANVLYDGCTYRNHVMDMHYTGKEPGVDITKYGTSASAACSRTGYYMAKFLDPAQTIDDNKTYASKQNYIIWRYAEVLLDYAEVLFRLGDTAAALSLVNQVRARVHMEPLVALGWDQLVNERRVELAFEETTYWDFFRWGIAEQKLNGSSNPLMAMRVDLNADGSYKYTVGRLNRYPGRIRKFNAKQYYLPIPWSEVKYHGIKQNPGWTEM